MPADVKYCVRCGRSAQTDERFVMVPAEGRLCPACAAGHPQSGGDGITYTFCDQCGGPIEGGKAELRLTTDTEVRGMEAFHRQVTLALCARCARGHDGTGRWMLVCAALFMAALGLLALLGWVLS